MGSSLWRGTTVTSSISQTKATSAGTRPCGSGRAIVQTGRSRTGLRDDERPGKKPREAVLDQTVKKRVGIEDARWGIKGRTRQARHGA